MVEYLSLVAEFNDGAFPDQVFPFDIASDRVNRVSNKPKDGRTAAEQRFLDARSHYMMMGLNGMPIAHFVQDRTAKDTFRYLGKGLNLGETERIVCWYKLKESGTYRAVYGDLSVKDVEPRDLPLPVEPRMNQRDPQGL